MKLSKLLESEMSDDLSYILERMGGADGGVGFVRLKAFLKETQSLSENEFETLIEQNFDDETFEILIEHLEDFFGIQDEEQLAFLTQVMIKGLMAGLFLNSDDEPEIDSTLD